MCRIMFIKTVCKAVLVCLFYLKPLNHQQNSLFLFCVVYIKDLKYIFTYHFPWTSLNNSLCQMNDFGLELETSEPLKEFAVREFLKILK